ncbi:MAG: ribosome hibernation-promoting factor, HPF/YfiA family [Candidatus Cloacimonadaceae bacterium]
MQITITARHFELTRAIRDHVETSCLKLNKYFDQIVKVHVILAWENNRNICEMTLRASKFTLQSEDEENDMYLAIDNAVEKMEAQIKKLKDRVTDHAKRPVKEYENFSRATYFQLGNKDEPRKLIKTKRIVPETLSVKEALDRLNKSNDDYYIFKNVETDGINVLVKQDEQHYKLFEP